MRRDWTCFASSEHFLVFCLENSLFSLLNSAWMELFYCSDLHGHSAPPLLRWPIWEIATSPPTPTHTCVCSHTHSSTINTTYYHLSTNTIPIPALKTAKHNPTGPTLLYQDHTQPPETHTTESKHVHRSMIMPISTHPCASKSSRNHSIHMYTQTCSIALLHLWPCIILHTLNIWANLNMIVSNPCHLSNWMQV